MKVRLVAALVAATVLCSCARIRHHTTTNPLPEELLGEWQGSWTSAGAGGTGPLVLSLREFHGEPVLGFDVQQSCLAPGIYTLTQTTSRWELRRGDEVVFSATVDARNRTLDGVYECALDRGTWRASWAHTLEPIGDISGIWEGTVRSVPAGLQSPFAMELQQTLRNGVLTLAGEISLPGLGYGVPIVGGQVVWGGATFDVLVQGGGTATQFFLHGTGESAAMSIEGDLSILDPRIPFRSGLWDAVRSGP